jgi:hypothetical protein
MNVIKITDRKYRVDSETTPGLTYYVTKRRDGSWYCECKSYKHHTDECKHILEVLECVKCKWEIYHNSLSIWDKAHMSPDSWLHKLFIGKQCGYQYWIAWNNPNDVLQYKKKVDQ